MKKYQHDGFTVEAGEGRFKTSHRLEEVPAKLWEQLVADQLTKVTYLDAGKGCATRTIQVFANQKTGSVFANYNGHKLVGVELWK